MDIFEEGWNGESAPMMPYFVSPGSIVKAAISKAKHQSHDERDSPSAPAKALTIIAESGNEAYGPDIHWVEGHPA